MSISNGADVAEKKTGAKMNVQRRWSYADAPPGTAVKWTESHVKIVNHDTGKAFYENKVRHPEGWSQNAVDTVASKYLRRADVPVPGGSENDVLQLAHRVADCLSKRGLDRGYFDEKGAKIFYDELVVGFLTQRVGFNSPVWFNFGLYDTYGIKGTGVRTRHCVDSKTGERVTLDNELERPGGAACFLSAVEDSLFTESGAGMFDHLSNETRIFLTGAGDGANVSNIRGRGEPIEGGGVSAGLISYLKVRDAASGYIKSGGKCLAPDQMVYTHLGPRRVDELADACFDSFLCLSYHPPSRSYVAKPAKAWLSGHKKRLVEVVTTRGTFKVSSDHPMCVATNDRQRFSTYQAGYLIPGTKLFGCLIDHAPVNDGSLRVHKKDALNTTASIGDMFEHIDPSTMKAGHVVTADRSFTLDCDSNDLANDECEVLSVTWGEESDVYSVEVECSTKDDKSPDSGHNFVIWPSDRQVGCGVAVHNTRRSATLLCLNVDHPDIKEFVLWKGEEEKKAKALIAAGYPSDFEGEAYATVSGQNSNNSVRCSDAFMEAVEGNEPWHTISRRPYSKFRDALDRSHLIPVGSCRQGELFSTKEDLDDEDGHMAILVPGETELRRVMERMSARGLWDLICETARECGCPGVQFDDTINRWNTVPKYGRINTTNPCFSGGTLVPTTDGLIRMEDWAREGTHRKIWNSYRWMTARSFPTKRAVVLTLRLSNGMEVTCTPDHRFKLIDGKEVLAKDSLDHQIAMSLPEPVLGEEIDDGMVAVGFVQGDGSYHAASGRFKYVHFGVNDGDVMDLFEGNGKKIAPESKPYVFSIDRDFGQLLGKLLKPTALPERDLRDDILTLPSQKLASFLRGLYSANGSVMAKHNRVTLKTTCRNLAKQVQQALVSLGIRSYITTNESKSIKFDNGTYECRESYDLNIASSDCVFFSERIGFVQKYKTEELSKIVAKNKFGRRLHPRVVEIIEGEEEQVYDFSFIDDLTDDERWACVSGLTAHNCAEVCLPDWSVCNLGSVNLAKFFSGPPEDHDIDGYEHACRLMTVALDLVVEISSYPTPMHAKGCHMLRSIGLNHGNVGAILMRMGLAYDSDEARSFMGTVTSAMTLYAWEVSHELAECLGSYPAYDRDDHAAVLRMHEDALEERADLNSIWCESLRERWREVCDLVGFRNNTVTCLVPQGTIGLVLDQDTMGCEPDFSLVKMKKCVGGNYMKIANASVEPALLRLGYDQDTIWAILDYVMSWGSMEHCPLVAPAHLSVFDTAVQPKNNLSAGQVEFSKKEHNDLAGGRDIPVTSIMNLLSSTDEEEAQTVLQAIATARTATEAFEAIASLGSRIGDTSLVKRYGKAVRVFSRSIPVEGHIDALAALQPHVSMSISKTTNMSSGSTARQVSDAYLRGWKSGVKCIAVYVDGSKQSQPLNAGGVEKGGGSKKLPSIEVLPDTAKMVEAAKRSVETWRDRWPAIRREADNHTDSCDQFRIRIGDPAGSVSVFLHVDRYAGTDDPMHVFIDAGKQGELTTGLLDTLSRVISMAVQHGVPLDKIGESMEGMSFGSRGILGKTSVFGIRHALSIPDLVGRVLKALPSWWKAGKPREMLHPPVYDPSHPVAVAEKPVAPTRNDEDVTTVVGARAMGYLGERCKKCNSLRTEGSKSCFLCKDCGEYNGPCGS
jgi:ribonucleotide reductase alpha subunit